MIERQKLIPAVILSAIGLLALKAISWNAGSFVPLSEQVAPRTAVINPDGSYDPNQFRGVTQMWARAREPYVITAPETTGSVNKPETPAQPAAQPPAQPPTQPPQLPQGAPRDRAGALNGVDRMPSPSERALAERLSERREEMEARQRELDMREKLLETAEKRLEGRVGELKASEDKAETTRGSQAGSETQVLKNLVIMYEAMKPRDAARVFDRLPADVLVSVVQQMNPRKMSEVLASMSPEAAEKLTVALASRARQRPTETAAAPTPTAQPSAAGNELPAITPAPPSAPAAPAAPARPPRAN